MPVQTSYPGVYIEEIPSGVRTITGVATSIAAFVGAAPRGRVGVPTTIFSFADYQRMFGGLSVTSSMSYAVNDFYANGGSQAIVLRIVNGATAAVYDLPTAGQKPNDVLALCAASPGTWGNSLTITVDANTKSPTNSNLFNLTIAETNGSTEVFRNLSASASDPTYYVHVLQQGSLLVSVVPNAENAIPNVAPSAGVVKAPSTGGTDGSALTGAQVSGSGLQAGKGGIYGLDKADLFNILVIPPLNGSTDVPAAVWQDAASYCQSRRAMLLVDPPAAWSAVPETAAATAFANYASLGVTGAVARNAALYFPTLNEADPLHNGNPGLFPPSGAIAGVYARTDANRGVWKAPAGVDATLNSTIGLSVNLTDAENGQLNPVAVNCLRTFTAAGQVVWGARTLAGADQLEDDYKYIPVRRLALHIEESLYRGTQWVVFEPNDEPLWGQIRTSVGSFMQQLFVQGAFAGSSRQSAYFVKCDSETTSQSDINLGVVNVIVGFAPLKPAEFVIIQIQQMAGQVSA